MRRTTRVALMTVGLSSTICGTFTAPALAQTDPPVWTRQVVVEGQLGSQTPLGVVGLAVDTDLLPWLSLSAGMGTDLFDEDEGCTGGCRWTFRQLALMPRLRRPMFDGATFVALGVGVSRNADEPGLRGPLVRQDDEIAVEHRFDNGLRVRAFAGIGFSVGVPHLPAFAGSLYYGAAVGYAVAPNPEQAWMPVPRWYGWQPLLSDILAASVAALGSPDGQAMRAAVALYALPPPIIHVAHHHYGRAALSAALRGVLPILFWKAFTKPNPDGGYDIAPASAQIAGALVAAVTDDLFLAWK